MKPGGGGCSELRSRHLTPAWVTRAKLCVNNNKKIPEMKQMKQLGALKLMYWVAYGNDDEVCRDHGIYCSREGDHILGVAGRFRSNNSKDVLIK